MASITREPNGRKTIQFVASDEKRRSIRLGKVSLKQAQAVKLKVEDLLASSITGSTPWRETSEWLADLDDGLHDKLASVGLVQRRGRSTLAAFIDAYTVERSDVKETTRTVYKRVRRYLVDYFGADKPLRDITPGDADLWRLNLLDKGLAENTVRRSCGIAKQLFTAAVRRRLVRENPFADLVAAVKANAERFYFVSRDEATTVLDACPDAEWRLLFALARYGGLRCPSEVLRLRWTDIDWERDRFTVTSPKTEHHEGGGSRICPIFPELRPYLLDAFEQAEEGDEYCIMRYRNPAMNLRTKLLRIIKQAGLNPWPKLWQNLRSTRETELADQFPAHVACAWIGNSVAVATKHYLQVTDDHFAQAVQNPVQCASATERTDGNASRPTPKEPTENKVLRKDATPCKGKELQPVGRTGLEPVTSCVSSRRSSQLS